MNKLIQETKVFLDAISGKQNLKDREEIETTYRFIEVLTFSSKKDIEEMLAYFLGKDFLGLPVWVRNLAYRLACLQDPEDKELLKAAAYDLQSFGPDWDSEATKLLKEASK